MPVNMKRMIAKELFSLIEEKGLDKLSVQMLATHCGISRQAFYYHFKDIGDVIDWSCQEALTDLGKKAERCSDPAKALQLYLDMARSHRHLINRFCESIHYRAFEHLICHYTSLFLGQTLEGRWPEHLVDKDRQEQFLDFYGPALFLHTLKVSQQPHFDTKKDAQSLAHLFLKLN